MLCSYAFDEKDVLSRREAQRCLANALYLKPDTRKIFVEVGGLEQYTAAFKATLKKRDDDDDFLLGRIGFLLTAKKDEIVERLVNEEGILTDITKVFLPVNVILTIDSDVLSQKFREVRILGGSIDALNGTTEVSIQFDVPC